ncbi:MAG: septum site-determining protein MinC [Bacillaceae bacterium]|uniref:Probable septum site-determining protein MinC n=1 Tax=Aeribacillus composti TaxID=1868734 RepID=A0ABY9WAZ3_9BACI|nr:MULTISPECIES: septum site-determining protein MinC [Aeribacillus]REJ21358.1 MAG: septum site-determining protein MinC [Bacillaceae bacterium]MDR9791550.1 septum site-determining protein MinC [Aeribacillus pallidus]MDR9795903.1 septum site-determining protein MinC [Aeribacillus pallidus]MED0652188.1 septum site-determining protein MinC [Aeribacillus composti]MED0702791.1 septum site-determining protein MinC [Aeribacillus composti]
MNFVKAQRPYYVTIKGTKDGLTLYLDDSCSFHDIVNELDSMLSKRQYVQENEPMIRVTIKAGNRFLTEEQEEKIKDVIRKKRNLIVDAIDSNVISKEEALKWKEEADVISVAKVVRSGQVLKIRGDLLLIGDVNPGGTVMATGNIFVMGALKGIAHAGFEGNRNAVIAASLMKPTQLRISDILSRPPDQKEPSFRNDMECAYIDENGTIIIERIQQLAHLRPNLTRLEGGIMNG